jgi:hypothetical protein
MAAGPDYRHVATILKEADVEGCAHGRRPPIGCNVKRESGAFSDEFSTRLVAGGEPLARQRLMAPLRLCLRRRLRMIISSQPVFFAWFRQTLHTPACQGRAEASFNRRAKRLHRDGPSRARLGLDRWGKLCWPEPGHHARCPHAVFGGARNSGRKANTSSIVASPRFIPPRLICVNSSPSPSLSRCARIN